MSSEAQKKAQKKYDKNSKGKFKVLTLKLNKETDSDVLKKLASVDNMQGYIKGLIRKDLSK